jgi:hypothetical protein
MCFLDTNADLGIEHQDSLYPGAWLRDISFNEGIRPNAYVGMWCQNNTANFYGSDAFGNAQLHYAESASIFWSIRANGTVSSNLFSAWYNGSTQFEPPKRLFMFKMHWSYLTNVNVVPTVTSLTLRIAVVSTGPVDGSPIFDVLPDHGFELDYSYVLLNNYFSIPITDGSGNLLIGTSPRSTADINFYPGSRNEPIISKPVLVSPVNGATNIALDAAFTLIPASHTKSLALTHRLFLSTNSNFAGVTPILLTARPAGVMVAGLGILFFMTAGMVIPFGSRKRRLLVMLATFCLFAGFAVLSSCSDDADVPGEITYTGASLESGKTYYWKVSATDPNGFYRTSDVSTFTAH